VIAGRLERAVQPRALVARVEDAAGTGVVFTLIDQPEDERDEALADTAWESVCATILTDPATATVTLDRIAESSARPPSLI
jgi:hypothetical protein